MEYATSPDRKENTVPLEQISIRVFDINVRLYVVLFPMPMMPKVIPYWQNTGVGISSRLAEENMKHIELLHEVADDSPPPSYQLCAAQSTLQERIAALMNRAPTGPPRATSVSPDDVFLFQSGMASIYCVHEYLLSKYNAKTVLFGFAFHSTPHVFEDFGPGYKFLSVGSAAEIDELERFLKEEAKEGRKIQAVWTEFPSNPLLTVPDVGRLRELADEYGFFLIVDDTVGSFCNVDLLPVADIVVTSLSKSFNGYADLLAASAVLNPTSRRYTELKTLFKEKYHNDFYNLDAEQLERNSRDYMSRSVILNGNAAALAAYFQPLTLDPTSCVKKVYYPSTDTSITNYTPYMRQPTPDFTPGYGCLMSVEFENMDATISFLEHLNVHQGPHLGAHLTLAMPYTKVLYGLKLKDVEKEGLRETQVRVAVGLEDTGELVETFRDAVVKADEAWKACKDKDEKVEA